jgi:hypothetical protein
MLVCGWSTSLLKDSLLTPMDVFSFLFFSGEHLRMLLFLRELGGLVFFCDIYVSNNTHHKSMELVHYTLHFKQHAN